ncbi:MAG TPA: hypothetical protein VNY36_04335 [Bacteroidia bacterium]|jgi:hypothetical protein|nr:hypothetical protein [Bacteroidia bacterium]
MKHLTKKEYIGILNDRRVIRNVEDIKPFLVILCNGHKCSTTILAKKLGYKGQAAMNAWIKGIAIRAGLEKRKLRDGNGERYYTIFFKQKLEVDGLGKMQWILLPNLRDALTELVMEGFFLNE